jgi:Ribbon-helix-helix protein, copG family
MARAKKLDAKIEVRLPDKLATAARRKADQLDRPLSQVIRELLSTWLATDQAQPTQAIK